MMVSQYYKIMAALSFVVNLLVFEAKDSWFLWVLFGYQILRDFSIAFHEIINNSYLTIVNLWGSSNPNPSPVGFENPYFYRFTHQN